MQPGYNRIDGKYRMTTAFDHSQEALEDRYHAMFEGGGRTDGGWIDPEAAAAQNQRARKEREQRAASWHYEQKHGPQSKGFSFTNPNVGESAFTSRKPPSDR